MSNKNVVVFSYFEENGHKGIQISATGQRWFLESKEEIDALIGFLNESEQQKISSMTISGAIRYFKHSYEVKEVECDRCGWVGTIAKHIPLKQAWCGGCRSSKIRIYKRPSKS